jgi:5-formyltetrahydrofolate cyclo-ligase
MLSKAALRQAFRANLDRAQDEPGHDVTQLATASRELCTRLGDYLKTQTGVWAGFEPMGFEPDIRPAIAHAKHIRWAYPRVEHETLKFYEVTDRSQLVKNQWHIWEPDPLRAKHVSFDELHGLLIPGLAFDQHGNRLGRGRGYYDRALSEIRQTCLANSQDKINQPLKIGIALERQVASQELPHDPHDIAMDLVITESQILNRPLAGAFKGTHS